MSNDNEVPPIPLNKLPAGLQLHEDFGDPTQLWNMRSWLRKALEDHGAKQTGAGMGMGEADIDFELEGHHYNVVIKPIIRSTSPVPRTLMADTSARHIAEDSSQKIGEATPGGEDAVWNAAIETAAAVAERDGDWTSFARQQKLDWKGFEENPVFGLPLEEGPKAYRHGLLIGKIIGQAIRALKKPAPSEEK